MTSFPRRKSEALVPRYYKFESISLQQRDAMGQAARRWHHQIAAKEATDGVP